MNGRIIKNDSLHHQRINNLCKNMIRKLKKNNIYSQPIEEDKMFCSSQKPQLEGI